MARLLEGAIEDGYVDSCQCQCGGRKKKLAVLRSFFALVITSIHDLPGIIHGLYWLTVNRGSIVFASTLECAKYGLVAY